uniref:PI3K/PI4K catalytic domain-containing protein n=1 Tax=Ananas comosus var. bracteatus TaxID=296719 RepID=A0A6V7PSL8_ANACO|nr:unnamed protein product [Ananas comosus var. bracteatus]
MKPWEGHWINILTNCLIGFGFSWIPQLLLSLQRNEAPHCKLVLLKIAQVYPQVHKIIRRLPLYYWLRTYLMERRDVTHKAEYGRNFALAQRMQQAASGHQGGAQSAGGSSGPHEGGNSQGQETERSAAEGGAGTTSHDQPPQSSVASEGSQIPLRRSGGAGALSWVAAAASAFEAAKDIMEALRNKHNNLANELEYLLSEIGSRFVTLPEERLLLWSMHCCTDATTTLAELTERLKHWKNVLQSNVEDRFPAVLKLEEEKVAPDHTIKLDRVGPDIPIVRRHGSSFRRLTLIGSDGSQRHFIVQTSLTPNARSDERMLQLFRVLNKMFDKHKEARRAPFDYPHSNNNSCLVTGSDGGG